MNWKIVADSSANLLAEAGVSSVPLRIMVGEREFVDDTALDVPTFLDALYRHKGRSSTACPGIGDWLAAFEGADAVFAVTITGALSGSCNAARLAGEQYEKEHPGAKVYVLDSLSTGPEMRLLTQRIRMQLEHGEPLEQVWQDVQHYASHTRLLFSLGSLHNLAQNGRVNPAVAAAVGLCGGLCSYYAERGGLLVGYEI